MELNYVFNGRDYTYDEVSYSEAIKVLLDTHSYDELLNDYLQYLYPTDSNYDKNRMFDEYGFDGTKEGIKDMSEEDKKDMIFDTDIVDDLIDLDLYNDELESYFEDDAYEAYQNTDFEDDMVAEWSRDYNRQRL